MPRPERSLARLALARGTLDRRADLRARPGILTELLADRRTRVLPVLEGRAPVREGIDGPALVLRHPEPGDADHLLVLLGSEGGQSARRDDPAGGEPTGGEPAGGDPTAATVGTAYLAVIAGDGDGDGLTLPPGGAPTGLRSVGARLPDLDAGLFTTALALANWHATHRHCPRCGVVTQPQLAGWIRRCPQDDSEHYPRTDPAVIMSVVDDDDRLLLAHGTGFAPRGTSVLAGFVEPGEPLAGAVAREVAEEVGIGVRDITYLGDQPWPFPSSLMVGFTARATGTELCLQDGEIDSAEWFSRAGLDAALADDSVRIPPQLSIARRLIEHWYGHEIDVPDLAVRRPG